MTATNISVQDFVQREVIYCVSSLIHTLTKENKLVEEQALELWTGNNICQAYFRAIYIVVFVYL